MANFTAADVKKLRESTGAGMMDCKKALDEAGGDLDKAVEILRVKGQKGVAKREGRSAENGAIVSLIADDNSAGVLLELKCETDFVAKGVAQHIAAFAPKYLSKEDVPAEVVESERRVAEETTRAEGKPEAALPKIVEGRLNGFFKDATLLGQPYALDNKKSVQKVLDEAGVTLKRFTRIKVGI